MNNQEVIDWKIASLVDQSSESMGEEMQTWLTNHQELADELTFIEQFWQSNVAEEIQPSAHLDANFYQMLSKAQTAQQQQEVKPVKNAKLSFVTLAKQWLTPKPLMQFATLGLVFVLGFNLNQSSNNRQHDSFASLQTQVSSLNTMLAMSMLQQSSATERLSGVAYSRESSLSSPELISQLINLLANDKSTAVRLAIINSLNDLESFTESEDTLLALTLTETNVLVQLELCRLLLNHGSAITKNTLTEQLIKPESNPEVREFIQAKLRAIYI